MEKEQSFKKGDIVICLDSIDSHGLLRKNKIYTVVDADGVRLQLENVPLTWINTRFKKNKKQ